MEDRELLAIVAAILMSAQPVVNPASTESFVSSADNLIDDVDEALAHKYDLKEVS